MSAITEKVGDAIFAKTNVAAVVGDEKLSGIHRDVAPAGTAYPFGVFGVQAPEPIEYTFGATQRLESGLWLFKVLADEDSTDEISPQKLAENLLAVWMTTLGTTLTLAGNTVVWCERFADIPPIREKVDDRWVFHRGCLVRIRVE